MMTKSPAHSAKDQSDFQTFKGDDRGFTEDEETGLVRRENFEETRGEQFDVAPKSVLSDALSQLEGVKQKESGVLSRIGRMFGGAAPVDAEIDTAQSALVRHLEAEGPQDARVGRAVVRQDAANYNPEMREYNDNRAEAESQSIARELFGRLLDLARWLMIQSVVSLRSAH